MLADAGLVAQRAAAIIADEAMKAIAARGFFVMAVSSGHTPWIMLRDLSNRPIPWQAVHVFKVDERVALADHPGRNRPHLRESLLSRAPLRPDQISAMPVESTDLDTAAADYAKTLQQIVGSPPVFVLAHLGLGPEGHTASLVHGDSALDMENTDVTSSGPYQGRRRITLTYPILNRARRVLWVVTGSEKAGIVNRLIEGNRSIPAGRIRSDRVLLLADCAASPVLTQTKDRLTKVGGVTCV